MSRFGYLKSSRVTLSYYPICYVFSFLVSLRTQRYNNKGSVLPKFNQDTFIIMHKRPMAIDVGPTLYVECLPSSAVHWHPNSNSMLLTEEPAKSFLFYYLCSELLKVGFVNLSKKPWKALGLHLIDLFLQLMIWNWFFFAESCEEGATSVYFIRKEAQRPYRGRFLK